MVDGLTPESLAEVINQIKGIYDYLEKSIELNQIFGESIEALEKQLATLAIGYAEQAVILEGLISLIDDEKLESFGELIKNRREAIFKAIEDGGDVLSGVIENFESSVGSDI